MARHRNLHKLTGYLRRIAVTVIRSYDFTIQLCAKGARFKSMPSKVEIKIRRRRLTGLSIREISRRDILPGDGHV